MNKITLTDLPLVFGSENKPVALVTPQNEGSCNCSQKSQLFEEPAQMSILGDNSYKLGEKSSELMNFCLGTTSNIKNPFSPGFENSDLKDKEITKTQQMGNWNNSADVSQNKIFSPKSAFKIVKSEKSLRSPKNDESASMRFQVVGSQNNLSGDHDSNNLDDVSSRLETSDDLENVVIMKLESTSPKKTATSVKMSAASKKLNKFQVRMDVVSKTIFRCIKAYYVEDFKKVFDFTQRRKRVNRDHSQEVYNRASEYLNTKFG